MNPDILWAPWRMAYVQGNPAERPKPVEPSTWRPGSDRGCFLCRAASASPDHDRDLGVVVRSATSLVVLNRFPYANGHLLVAPLDHRATLADLDRTGLLDLQELLVEWWSPFRGGGGRGERHARIRVLNQSRRCYQVRALCSEGIWRGADTCRTVPRERRRSRCSG